jgi:ankyrin repeat protein
MHYAAWRGHADCIAALALLGLSVNIRSKNGLTPLMVATGARTVRTLLRLGADANAQDKFGLSALHNYAEQGDLESAVVLVQEGNADMELVDNKGFTPISHAVDHSVDMVIAMAKLGANVNANRNSIAPLIYALNYGPPGLVALAQMGADVNARQSPSGDTVLHTAAQYDCSESISTLVDLGAYVEAFSAFKTPLAVAAHYGNLDTMAELIASGADVEGRCHGGMWCDQEVVCLTPLQVALFALKEDAALELIRY